MTENDIKSHNDSVARRIYNIFAEMMRVPLFIIKGAVLGIQILKHKFSSATKNSEEKAARMEKIFRLQDFSTHPKILDCQATKSEQHIRAVIQRLDQKRIIKNPAKIHHVAVDLTLVQERGANYYLGRLTFNQNPGDHVLVRLNERFAKELAQDL